VDAQDLSDVSITKREPADEQALPYLGQASLRDRVIDALERRILEGGYPAGARIPTETVLGERFGVSRTVIRDALRVLEARGLVDIRRGTGTRVRATTADTYVNAAAMLLIRSELTVGDVLDARQQLESYLALVAAENHTAEDLEKVSFALEEFADAVGQRNPTLAARSHVKFHSELLRATRLPAFNILLQPLQQMMLATSLVPSGIAEDDPRGWRVDTHRRLVEAIETRSPEAVKEANAEHWTYTRGPSFDELRVMRIGDVYSAPQDLVAESRLDSWQG
jgi:GntR family transcriptional regulator, transcriptional repressor for pyruvate dehydrogenase complex